MPGRGSILVPLYATTLPIKADQSKKGSGNGYETHRSRSFRHDAGGGFAVSSSPVLAAEATPAGKAAGDGIFTTDQSKRGEAVYNENCAMCHQPDLGGKEPVPELAGDKFLSHWANHNVGEFFTRVSTTMPQGKPGSLTHDQYIDVIAFIIDANGYKSGTTELKADSDALKTITISGNH